MSEQAPDLSRLANVNRVLHEPTRTQIASLLYVLESADFIFLMNQLGLTWGNLSAHLSKLEEVGYVEIIKGYRGKRPNTSLRLTEDGRQAFREYINSMRELFRDLPV